MAICGLHGRRSRLHASIVMLLSGASICTHCATKCSCMAQKQLHQLVCALFCEVSKTCQASSILRAQSGRRMTTHLAAGMQSWLACCMQPLQSTLPACGHSVPTYLYASDGLLYVTCCIVLDQSCPRILILRFSLHAIVRITIYQRHHCFCCVPF